MELSAAVKGGGEELRCNNHLTAMEAASPTVSTHKIHLEASTHMVMLVGRRISMIGA